MARCRTFWPLRDREVDTRGLYLRRGFGTIFEYAVRELGYSDAAAWRRMKAMELCEETDGARDLLQNGLISLSTAAELQSAFDRQKRNAPWCSAAWRRERGRSPGKRDRRRRHPASRHSRSWCWTPPGGGSW